MSFTQSAFAFKGKNCWDKVMWGPGNRLYKSLMGGNHRDGYLIRLFGLTSGGVSSTLSSVSSTGECSAIAEIEKQKMIYYATNYQQIKIQSAQGNGEHLSVLAYLYGREECAENFKATIKQNFGQIFSAPDSPEKLDSEIKMLLSRTDCV